MIRRPPRSTRTDTPFPYTTRFRSVLDPAEGRHLDAVARNLPDVDRPDAQLGHETGDMLEVVGADAGGQAVGRRVGDPDRVVDIREADHRRDGAESLLAHQLAIVGHAVDDGRWVESSEERRVGKERVRTCRSGGSPYHT